MTILAPAIFTGALAAAAFAIVTTLRASWGRVVVVLAHLFTGGN